MVTERFVCFAQLHQCWCQIGTSWEPPSQDMLLLIHTLQNRKYSSETGQEHLCSYFWDLSLVHARVFAGNDQPSHCTSMCWPCTWKQMGRAGCWDSLPPPRMICSKIWINIFLPCGSVGGLVSKISIILYISVRHIHRTLIQRNVLSKSCQREWISHKTSLRNSIR